VPHFLLSYLPWNTLQCLHWKCMPEWKAVNMSFLMSKVGLNVFFSINQSVSRHKIMVLLPYVSQLSNVTSQFKDIYGLHVGVQLVMKTGHHRRLCRFKKYARYVPKIPQGRTHSYYPCHFNRYFLCQNVDRTQIAYKFA
jgi:hypothetical protein